MIKDKLLTIKQTAEILGVSTETLRNWDKNKSLPSIRTKGKHRRWKMSDIHHFMNINIDEINNTNTVAIYGRVSSHDQKTKGDLDRQCQRLSEYCSKHQYQVNEIIKDIGSGLSDSRKGLLKLFNLVVNQKINKVIVENKDRLTRFGFKFFEYFFNSYNVKIEIIDNNKKQNNNDDEELVEDIIMLMASFSGKLYGKRSARKRKNL